MDHLPDHLISCSSSMSFVTLSAAKAAALDKELMSSCAYSIDQLMELAGLAVAHAIYSEYPPAMNVVSQVLVVVGPGNNGGDGLVAARHLKLWGAYEPIIYYPKQPDHQLYRNLVKQLDDLGVQQIRSFDNVRDLLLRPQSLVGLIIDSLFGFSFHPPIREPFTEILQLLSQRSSDIPPIVSIDIPSGWDVDSGPPSLNALQPQMLVSLTAPKPCARIFAQTGKAHYLGGRFIGPKFAGKYGIESLISKYTGDNMTVRL